MSPGFRVQGSGFGEESEEGPKSRRFPIRKGIASGGSRGFERASGWGGSNRHMHPSGKEEAASLSACSGRFSSERRRILLPFPHCAFEIVIDFQAQVQFGRWLLVEFVDRWGC